MRRVVITGLGAVSPVGTGVDAMWDALIAGTSGIGPITAFDVSAYPTRFAGCVDDWDPTPWIDAKEARRLSRFQQFAVAEVVDLCAEEHLGRLPRPGQSRVAVDELCERLRQPRGSFQVVQRGQQLVRREVAGRTENHERAWQIVG